MTVILTSLKKMSIVGISLGGKGVSFGVFILNSDWRKLHGSFLNFVGYLIFLLGS